MSLAHYKEFPVALPMAGCSGDPDSVGYVYVIGFGEADIVKIGAARCIASRLEALQTSTPFELHARAAVSIYDMDPMLVEKHAHRLAKKAGHHIRGEWFDMSVDDALRCVIEAAKAKRAKYGSWAQSVQQGMDDAKQRGEDYETERRNKLRMKLGMT